MLHGTPCAVTTARSTPKYAAAHSCSTKCPPGRSSPVASSIAAMRHSHGPRPSSQSWRLPSHRSMSPAWALRSRRRRCFGGRRRRTAGTPPARSTRRTVRTETRSGGCSSASFSVKCVSLKSRYFVRRSRRIRFRTAARSLFTGTCPALPCRSPARPARSTARRMRRTCRTERLSTRAASRSVSFPAPNRATASHRFHCHSAISAIPLHGRERGHNRWPLEGGQNRCPSTGPPSLLTPARHSTDGCLVQSTASDLLARVDAVLPGLLTPGLIESIAPALERRVLAPGAILFMEGDPSDAMYVTLRGSLRVSIAHPERGAVVVGHVGPGAPVGEMQILSGGTRTATVTAETESEIVRVPRIAFERVATEAPDVMRHLNDVIRRRVRRNQLVAILPRLFGPLDDQTLGEIEAAVTWVSLPRASTLFRQGDVGDAAYIVVNGRLRAVVRDAHGVEKTVGEIQRGETVGEMAIFTGEARSATVDAVRDSDLVRLDRPAFERLISARPQALLALTRLTINRLRNVQSAAPVANPVIAVAIVAAGLHAPLAAFAARVATALRRMGPTAHRRASDLDCQLATPGLA